MVQYTIRSVPDSVDTALRERARRTGVSLNQAALEALRRGLGLTDEVVTYDDLDDLAGTWQADEVFERAISEQDSVDEELWR